MNLLPWLPDRPERTEVVHHLTQAAFAPYAALARPSGALTETVDDVAADLAAGGGLVGGLAGGILAGLLAAWLIRWTLAHRFPATTANIVSGALAGLLPGLLVYYVLAPVTSTTFPESLTR